MKRLPLPAQRGSTLIEALLAVVVFSFGVLALVGVEGSAIKSVQAAKSRADASNLADQIVAMMWADRGNLAAYAHYPGGTGSCTNTGSASANANVTAWIGQVTAALPGATSANQQIVIGANNVVTVTLCWKLPEDATWHNFSERAQING